MNGIQVITFCSGQTLYGVMDSQIASLSRYSAEAGETITDLVQLLEGQGPSRSETGQWFVITNRKGPRFRIPGPLNLYALRPDDFQLMPTLVSRVRTDDALRAAFLTRDSIGLLVDMDRVIVPAQNDSQDGIHQGMV